MPIAEIQCIILCHKAEQSAGLKFFEPAIKVENWQMEIEYFHNFITAWKETVGLHPVLKRTKDDVHHSNPHHYGAELYRDFPWESHTAKGTCTENQTCRGNKKLQK